MSFPWSQFRAIKIELVFSLEKSVIAKVGPDWWTIAPQRGKNKNRNQPNLEEPQKVNLFFSPQKCIVTRVFVCSELRVVTSSKDLPELCFVVSKSQSYLEAVSPSAFEPTWFNWTICIPAPVHTSIFRERVGDRWKESGIFMNLILYY